MMPEIVRKGRWKCQHEGGHHTVLRDHERLEKPPHYVICPDCGTHWIVYRPGIQTMAMPVIMPMEGPA